MKKSVPGLAGLFLISSICFSQNEGYKWSFYSSPFNSTPAVPGSPGNYVLTTVGTGSITPGVSDNVGLGTSCVSPVPVGDFTKPLGLVFSNSPAVITDTYTIEMVFTFYGPTPRGRKRLVNFESPLSGAERGFYVWNNFNVYIGFNNGNFYGPNFSENVYAQVDIVRDGATKTLTFYKDGNLIGSETDPNDFFMPRASGNFEINFFKDCNGCGEESSGRVVKIIVYNYKLNNTEIQQNFNSICASGTLPVSLQSFTATKVMRTVELAWITSSEQNNKGFEIQRSTDGVNFNNIGWVIGVGNSTSLQNYSFTDIAPTKGKNFYRLNQVDIDNKSKLSAIRKVDFTSPFDITVYPNPATDVLNVQVSKNITGVKIFDAQGKLMWQQENNTGLLSIPVPVHKLTAGLYILEVSDAAGNKQLQKFIKE